MLILNYTLPHHEKSTLLKSDQWHRESHQVAHGVRGAINFRHIPNTKIFALGQPTVEAIDEVVGRVKEAYPDADRIIWLTLREEPIVYVNGAPYCLRRERFSLRNMKGAAGVTSIVQSSITNDSLCASFVIIRLWWYLCF